MTNNPTATIRLGIIGLGNMGSLHARSVIESKMPGMRLTAVCESTRSKWSMIPTWRHSPTAVSSPLRRSNAVLIATPHYWRAKKTAPTVSTANGDFAKSFR